MECPLHIKIIMFWDQAWYGIDGSSHRKCPKERRYRSHDQKNVKQTDAIKDVKLKKWQSNTKENSMWYVDIDPLPKRPELYTLDDHNNRIQSGSF